MSRGEMVFWGLWLITIGNAVWAWLNWRITKRAEKKALELLENAENYKQRAEALLHNAHSLIDHDADTFRVCGECGKIVRGPCENCVGRALRLN